MSLRLLMLVRSGAPALDHIDEVVDATRAITVINKDEFRKSLVALSRVYTAQADLEFDEHGKIIRKKAPGNDLGLTDTIVIDRNDDSPDPEMLFDAGDPSGGKKKRNTSKAKGLKKNKKKSHKR